MNKAIITLGVAGVLVYTMPLTIVKSLNVSAASYNEIQPMTAGLIKSYSLNIYTKNGYLYINGSVTSNTVLKSIGYKNIVIEKSFNGSNWSEEKDISDLLISDSKYYYLNDYSVSVKGGYYYRVTCTHYAKESGLFGSSQSVDNTSNSVWIS